MNILYRNISVWVALSLMMASVHLAGQVSVIVFDDVEYQMEGAFSFTDGNNEPVSDNSTAARELLQRSFANDNYEEYRDMYVPGECKVSLEDYVNWRAQLDSVLIEIDATYHLKTEAEEYIMVAYRYTNQYGQFRLGVGMKITPQGVKYLAAEESIAMQGPVVFFSRVKQSTVAELVSGPVEDSEVFDLGVIDGNRLDGSRLLGMEVQRHGSSANGTIVDSIFEKYYSNVNNNSLVRSKINGLSNYLEQLNIDTRERARLKSMAEDYLVAQVVIEVTEITGKSQQEVAQEIRDFIKDPDE